MSTQNAQMAAIVVIYFVFVVGFVYYWNTLFARRRGRRLFFTALINILQRPGPLGEQVGQVDLNFRKLSEYNRYISQELRGPEALIEWFIHLVDTGRVEYLKSFGAKDLPVARQSAEALLNEMRRQRPFSSLPPQQANLMSLLRSTADARGDNMSRELIRQLTEELDTMHSRSRTQERNNRIAYGIGVVGVVLTTFFGIISLFLVR